jgi:hypothetical protein
VCVQWRAEECRRFGLVPTSNLDMGPTQKRARDALAHHGASQLASLGGGACCVVCLSSNCSNNWLLSGHRGAIFGGACVGVREQAPTLKEVHKEQVGLATHASTTATQ